MNENIPQITLLKLQACQLREKSQLLMESNNFNIKLIGDGEIENEEDYKKSIMTANRMRIDYDEFFKLDKEYEEIRVKLNSLDGNKNVLKKLKQLEPLDFNID